MKRSGQVPKPTDAELSILRVLWQRGPATVREVYEELNANRALVYTTVLKLLQIMTEKGLVTREGGGRAHVYCAAQTKEDSQSRLLGDLMDRVFEGSTQKLVLQALSHNKASREELDEIRMLIDKLERESQ